MKNDSSPEDSSGEKVGAENAPKSSGRAYYSIRLAPDLTASIDAILDSAGAGENRSAFVDRVVRGYLRRRRRGQEIRERIEGRTVLTEGGKVVRVHRADARRIEARRFRNSSSVEEEFVQTVLEQEQEEADLEQTEGALSYQEIESGPSLFSAALWDRERKARKGARQRLITLRRFQQISGKSGADAIWRPDGSITLPLTVVSWLQESLGIMRDASNAAAHQRRKQTMEESGLADPEVRAAYNRQRADYAARYGEEEVERAVGKAGRHRTRAREAYQISEHFSAWEWLDLLETFGFRCALCGEGKETELEPHHGRELHLGGSNTIGNILPICPLCHGRLHMAQLTLERGWQERQSDLCQRFRPGQKVRYIGRSMYAFDWSYEAEIGPRGGSTLRPVAPVGELVQVLPAEPYGDPLWKVASRLIISRYETSAHGIVLPPDGGEATLWKAARALVRWSVPSGGRPYSSAESQESSVALEFLAVREREEWLGAQRELYAGFDIGDMVRGRGEGEHLLPGVIMRLLEPEAREDDDSSWVEGRAEVYRAGGVQSNASLAASLSIQELSQFKRLDAAAWLAEQNALCAGFQTGDLVRLSGSKRRTGTVVRFTMPELCPPWSESGKAHPFALPSEWVPWRAAQIWVRWEPADGEHEQQPEPVAPQLLGKVKSARPKRIRE